MTAPLTVLVPGQPVPQGSFIGRLIKGRAYAVPSNEKKLRVWRKTVHNHAAAAMTGRDQFPGAVAVQLAFYLPRPKTVTRPRPSVSAKGAGDVDKLTRAVFDALTTAGVYADDARVVDLGASKFYSHTPGVRIHVRDADLDAVGESRNQGEEA